MRRIDHLSEAFSSLLAKPVRAVLTGFGVVIGSAALIATLSIGAGARQTVDSQLQALGTNVLMILPVHDQTLSDPHNRSRPLNISDAEALADALPEVSAAAPAIRGETRMIFENRNWKTRINGTTPAFFEIRDWSVNSGRIFSAHDEARAAPVVVIGTTVAQRLFDGTDPIGKQVRIGNTPLTVIGVLEPKGQSANGRDQDDIAFLPFQTAERRLGLRLREGQRGTVSYIMAKNASGDDPERVADRIDRFLRDRHRSPHGSASGFQVRNPAAVIAARQQTTRTVGALLATIAAITLFASGIGVMNIMLVAVSERVREIGLRLAVGAHSAQIAAMFLVEAVLICLGGAIVGIGAGAAGALLIGRWTGWPVVIDGQSVLIAIVFAVLIGVVFGYLPARRAARTIPAQALRA